MGIESVKYRKFKTENIVTKHIFWFRLANLKQKEQLLDEIKGMTLNTQRTE